MKPIHNAQISDSKNTVLSDALGVFTLNSNDDKFHIKYYGYRPYTIENNINKSINFFTISPIKVKSLYLSFWGANLNSKTCNNLLKIIKEKEINALVIDVKSEYGSTSYKTSFGEGNDNGIWHKRTIKDISKFMQVMKENNIYTIARIVTFKDNIQAMHNSNYAIKNSKGKIWRNGDKMAWVDPFDKRSHNYTLSIAEDAAKVGFDEINFDYIRFPAKNKLKYSKKFTRENRVGAITSFLKSAHERLLKYGVYISVNAYGNIFRKTGYDSNIGQEITSLAKYSDYIYPMLYPSGFATNSFGKRYPSRYPYEVIYESIKDVEHLINPNRIRPWLQYFKDYSRGHQEYGKRELDLQIKGADDALSNGWLVWSPSSKYNIHHFKSDK